MEGNPMHGNAPSLHEANLAYTAEFLEITPTEMRVPAIKERVAKVAEWAAKRGDTKTVLGYYALHLGKTGSTLVNELYKTAQLERIAGRVVESMDKAKQEKERVVGPPPTPIDLGKPTKETN